MVLSSIGTNLLLQYLYRYKLTATISLKTTQSDTKPITHGVPQGSILGPILFIIDINDFSGAYEKLFSILYADDTSILIEGYEYDQLMEIMNN